MAKMDFNAGNLLPHGIIGNMLWRRRGNTLIISAVPRPSRRKATAKQTTCRQRFKGWTDGAKQLLADPKERAACQRLAEQKHWPLWNTAISRASRSRH